MTAQKIQLCPVPVLFIKIQVVFTSSCTRRTLVDVRLCFVTFASFEKYTLSSNTVFHVVRKSESSFQKNLCPTCNYNLDVDMKSIKSHKLLESGS